MFGEFVIPPYALDPSLWSGRHDVLNRIHAGARETEEEEEEEEDRNIRNENMTKRGQAQNPLLVESCELAGRSTKPDSLHKYAEQGNIFELGTLLASSLFEVNYLDADGKAPLHYAAARGHAHCCKALLRSQADPLLQSSEGKSCLTYAAENYEPGTFQLLLDAIKVEIHPADGKPAGVMHELEREEEMSLSDLRVTARDGMSFFTKLQHLAYE
eukprot:763277-Hanusia_phi.AAC.2